MIPNIGVMKENLIKKLLENSLRQLILTYTDIINLLDNNLTPDELVKLRDSYSILESKFRLISSVQIENKINNMVANKEETNMQPLKYGQGSIRQKTIIKKDGTEYKYYEARYYKNGEQHTLTAKTQKKCLERLRIATSSNKNKKVDRYIKLSDWLESWYQLYKVPNLSQSALKGIRIVMDKYIIPTIGKKTLSRLTTDNIQECLNKITYPRQKETTKNTINNALNQAVINKLIRDNPCKYVICPKTKNKKTVILTQKQQETLLEKISGTELYNPVICYLYTGCRRNELLNIRKQDVDLNNNLIKINGTKTNSSIRIIPLFNQIKDIIIKLYNNSSNYLFTIKQDQLNRKFRDICDKLNLYDVTIHSLRHTFATNCFMKGISIKTVQSWMGHSNYQITANIYTHLTTDFMLEEIEKMNQN